MTIMSRSWTLATTHLRWPCDHQFLTVPTLPVVSWYQGRPSGGVDYHTCSMVSSYESSISSDPRLLKSGIRECCVFLTLDPLPSLTLAAWPLRTLGFVTLGFRPRVGDRANSEVALPFPYRRPEPCSPLTEWPAAGEWALSLGLQSTRLLPLVIIGRPLFCRLGTVAVQGGGCQDCPLKILGCWEEDFDLWASPLLGGKKY